MLNQLAKLNIDYVTRPDGDYELDVNCIEYTNTMGTLHRDDGPARIIIKDKSRNYLVTEKYILGQKHCFDGPAVVKYIPMAIDQPIIFFDDVFEFWFNGVQVPTSIVKEWLIEQGLRMNPFKWTEEVKFYFALYWSNFDTGAYIP